MHLCFRDLPNKVHAFIIVKINIYRIKKNNYLSLQIQKGRFHQPQCPYTSAESCLYCHEQKRSRKWHLSYMGLFSWAHTREIRNINANWTHTKDKNRTVVHNDKIPTHILKQWYKAITWNLQNNSVYIDLVVLISEWLHTTEFPLHEPRNYTSNYLFIGTLSRDANNTHHLKAHLSKSEFI